MSRDESVHFTIKLSREELSLLQNKARNEGKELAEIVEELVRSALQHDNSSGRNDSDLQHTVARVLKEYAPLFKKLARS